MLRKEEIQLKNMSKDFNTQRAFKKRQYQEQELRDKIAKEDIKKEQMIEERNQLKQQRMNALFEMEKQRQDIRKWLCKLQ